MTKREAAIITAYTGIFIGDWDTFHKYANEVMGGSIWTHEFGNKEVMEKLKFMSRRDFINISIED